MNVLNCLGVGMIASNKQTDTDEVMLYLPKDMPSQDGEVIAKSEESDVTFTSSAGDTQTSKVLTGNAVPAKWMKSNTNRITSPDVRVGTKVVVYQWMGSNNYLWTLEGLDGSMRLETVMYAFSASDKIDENSPITPDNYYVFIVSTHTGKIELLTGQGNGEALGFQLTLNLKEGWWGTMDSLMNIFMVNGVERSFTYTNQDKSTLSINKKDFSIITEGHGLINPKESLIVKTKHYSLDATETYDMRTKTATIDGDSTTWTAGSGFKIYANTEIDGTLTATDVIRSLVDVYSANISGKGHKHGGVQSGGSTSSTPI